MFDRRAAPPTLLGLLALLALSACEETEAPLAERPPPAVTVAHPVVREITEWDEYSGRFQAVETVEVRSRVSGYLDSIHFVDGQIVEQGDLLFVIDPRPFEVALEQTEAELERDRTRVGLAEKEVERARPLLDRGNIPESLFDERVQGLEEARASVAASEAAVAAAKLNLDYTQIRAPVGGRISRNLVSVGNLVSGGTGDASLLTTIVSLDPIQFYFDADEKSYLKYTRLANSGERPSSRNTANPVYLSLADEDGFLHEGKMDFVENQFDFDTGTIRGRAIFDNEDLLFLPGLFAKIRLVGSGAYDAILLPDEAIGTDQSRKFVYLVGDDDVVTIRLVEPGPLYEGLRVIREGLTPDDLVIVTGLQRARPGERVTPTQIDLTAQGDATGAQ